LGLTTRVRIAGAGPAGLTCAIVLARAGVEVELHEKNDRLGARFPGDLHGIENWSSDEDFLVELGRMGIAPTFTCTPFRRVLIGTKRLMQVLHSTRPLFYVLRRGAHPGTLEQGLLEQALAAGVSVHLRSRKTASEVDIIATGPDPKRRFCIETGIRFRTGAPDMAVALIDEAAAPRGYAYLLVRDGIGCLCAVLFDRFSQALHCLERSRQVLEPFVGGDVREPERLGGYGAFRIDGCHAVGDTCQIGEAAGLQDLVWAFGIRTAMASGYVAAECLLAGQDYQKLARVRLDRPRRVGLVLRLLWERSPQLAFPLYLRLLRSRADSLDALRAACREGMAHRLLLPYARARLERRHTHLAI
jgi:flavin-dependent dehydrogenase